MGSPLNWLIVSLLLGSLVSSEVYAAEHSYADAHAATNTHYLGQRLRIFREYWGKPGAAKSAVWDKRRHELDAYQGKKFASDRRTKNNEIRKEANAASQAVKDEKKGKLDALHTERAAAKQKIKDRQEAARASGN